MLRLADWGALNASSLTRMPSSQFPIRHAVSVTFGVYGVTFCVSVGNLFPIGKTISSHSGHLNRESDCLKLNHVCINVFLFDLKVNSNFGSALFKKMWPTAKIVIIYIRECKISPSLPIHEKY